MTIKQLMAYLGQYSENINLNLFKEMLTEFKETQDVSTSDATIAALEAGGDIALTADVDLAKGVKVTQDMTLDLNGQTMYNTNDIWDTTQKIFAFVMHEGDSTITIKGGNMIAKKDDQFCVDITGGGTCIIEGGYFNGNISAIQVEKGLCIIENGEFDMQQVEESLPDDRHRYLLNCIDANYQAGLANFIVKGGRFHNYNPADNQSEGPHTNYVAEGYESIEVEPGIWEVRKAIEYPNN